MRGRQVCHDAGLGQLLHGQRCLEGGAVGGLVRVYEGIAHLHLLTRLATLGGAAYGDVGGGGDLGADPFHHIGRASARRDGFCAGGGELAVGEGLGGGALNAPRGAVAAWLEGDGHLAVFGAARQALGGRMGQRVGCANVFEHSLAAIGIERGGALGSHHGFIRLASTSVRLFDQHLFEAAVWLHLRGSLRASIAAHRAGHFAQGLAVGAGVLGEPFGAA